jgi:hypothetical protein
MTAFRNTVLVLFFIIIRVGCDIKSTAKHLKVLIEKILTLLDPVPTANQSVMGINAVR